MFGPVLISILAGPVALRSRRRRCEPLVLWSPGPLVSWSAGLRLRLLEGYEYCEKLARSSTWSGALEKEGLMQMTTFAVFEMLRILSMTAFDLVKSQENCKFQCVRWLKSYACLRNKKCYECHRLEHRELLESYDGMFQIRVFAPPGKVSILQITIIS